MGAKVPNVVTTIFRVHFRVDTTDKHQELGGDAEKAGSAPRGVDDLPSFQITQSAKSTMG